MNRTLTVLAASAATALAHAAHAQEPVVLRIAHFFPPQATAAAGVLDPWCAAIEADSAGQLTCEIYPALQLGGTPAQMYSQVTDGIADGAIVVPSYTPGRFPKLAVFQLPFISASGEATSVAAQQFAEKHAGEEIGSAHLVGVWASDPIIIHSREAIETTDDLGGFTIRAGTAESAAFFEELGASPASMPINQTPDALSKGVIDAAVATWEIAPALRLGEMAPYKISPDPAAGALFTTVLSLMLNQDVVDGLPENLQQVIRDNSGVEFSRAAGRAFDEAAEAAKQAAAEAGNTVVSLSPEETAKLQEAATPVTKAWVEQMDDAGENGQAMLDEIGAAIDEAQAAIN